jgi:hypothetical protein
VSKEKPDADAGQNLCLPVYIGNWGGELLDNYRTTHIQWGRGRVERTFSSGLHGPSMHSAALVEKG